MLKKRHTTWKVILLAVAIFAVAVFVLWYINQTLHFRTKTTIFTTIALAVFLAAGTLSLTVGRAAEVKEQDGDYPPKGINPIQAGCIADGRVNSRDVAAAFFYMAQKSYFRIEEYELKKFVFVRGEQPHGEEAAIKFIYDAIFHNKEDETVKLEDCAERLAKNMRRIQTSTYNSISNKRNKEIADLTGKVFGFKKTISKNNVEKATALVKDNPDYIFEVLSFAYALSVSAKLSRNLDKLNISSPEWYKPYGVADDYTFDVVIYNSIIRNLPEQLNALVFSKVPDVYPPLG